MDKKKYIFDHNAKRIPITTRDNIEHSKYYYKNDRNMTTAINITTKQIGERHDIELKAVNLAIGTADQYDLTVEVIWSSLRAMKKSKGSMSILTALQCGKSEWDI